MQFVAIRYCTVYIITELSVDGLFKNEEIVFKRFCERKQIYVRNSRIDTIRKSSSRIVRMDSIRTDQEGVWSMKPKLMYSEIHRNSDLPIPDNQTL